MATGRYWGGRAEDSFRRAGSTSCEAQLGQRLSASIPGAFWTIREVPYRRRSTPGRIGPTPHPSVDVWQLLDYVAHVFSVLGTQPTRIDGHLSANMFF